MSHDNVYGDPERFEEEFPSIKIKTIHIEQPLLGGRPPRTWNYYGRPPNTIKCSNPNCSNGGLDLESIRDFLAKILNTNPISPVTETFECKGWESGNRRECIRGFHVTIDFDYK